MTLQELMEAVLPILPNAMFEEGDGDDGEIIILTGLREKKGTDELQVLDYYKLPDLDDEEVE